MAEKRDLIYFSNDVIKFEPLSTVNNVFFDEHNKQVFAVRSDGVMGVQVYGPNPNLCHSFCMPDRGPVAFIKLSPSQTILAIQRSKTSIDLMNLKNGELDDRIYSPSSRFKGVEILGFVWANAEEIILISTKGVELFQVNASKRTLHALCHVPVNIKWYKSCPSTRLLLLATGNTASSMQPILYRQLRVLEKTPKFEIDVPVTSSKGNLQERDVTITQLYDQTCILVVRHPPRPPGSSPPLAQVLVYAMNKLQKTVRITHTLELESCSKTSINIVDNVILIHQQTKSTLLFDTGGDTGSIEPITVKPFIEATSIRPYVAQLPGQEPFACQLYSYSWVFFQPNIIIDAKIGFLWYIELDLPLLISSVQKSAKLVAFLLRRKPDVAMPLLMKVIEEITEPRTTAERNLTGIAEVFNTINKPYRREINVLSQRLIATPVGGIIHSSPSNGNRDIGPDMISIDQSLMYSKIFSKFPEMKGREDYDGDFAIKVLLEYIRSLADVQIPAYDLNELLITCLLDETHGFSKLHQLLQYRVLSDSMPLACALVSLEQLYPPALQISLDMLKRLDNSNDEIIEILLHKNVLTALRYAVAVGLGDKISARKFLEAALKSNNRDVFFSVFRFFETRNERQRGSTSFVDGEQCSSFVEHFRKLFIVNTDS